ncbi:MAG: TIGR03118 family protein, partial [Acidobacteriota bacterium]|nr:TIGR03118 family protein [Acidobacteriota bacterium]
MPNHRSTLPAILLASAIAAFVFTFPVISSAQLYVQKNLVTSATDSDLINPWGMVQSSGSPFWISDQGTNVSTLYDGAGTKQGLVVGIPTVTGKVAGFPPNGPTGIVFNTGTGFDLPGAMSPSVKSIFIFANLNGQISGWNPGSTAGLNTSLVEVNNSVTTPPPTTVYTGLAINATGTLLYAANYNAGGGIQAFNSNWTKSSLTFTDPSLPAGYEPYNVADINGTLFVEYSQIGSNGLPVVAAGNG